MERAYYIPRGAPIKIFDFFYLKNFDRRFRFPKNLAVSVGPVCFGLAKPAGALLRACLSTLVLYAFATYVLFAFCFLLCVVTSFFRFVFTKLVVHFFSLLHIRILYPFLICIVRNCVCAWLTFFLHFDFVCAIACLLYFLQCFCTLLHSILRQNRSLLHNSLFAGSSRCHILVLIVFLPSQFASFCGFDLICFLSWGTQFVLWCFYFRSPFFDAHFARLHFVLFCKYIAFR